MKLHILYRSYGGDNAKPRPPFYSKALALKSLLAAQERSGVDTEILFLNDGPVPRDCLDLMTGAGEVIPIRGGSNRRSHRRALRVPRQRGWSASDLVWFSEDDYLYAPDSMQSLVAAAGALPAVDYFCLYASDRFAPTATRRRPAVLAQHRSSGDADAVLANGRRWYGTVSTTSTFGCRVGAIREDQWLHRLCSYSGGSWDHTTCLSYQGYQPFPWRRLFASNHHPEYGEHLEPDAQSGSASVNFAAGIAALWAIRSAINLAALTRRPGRRRLLFAPDPEAATHMEEPYLAPGSCWSEIARNV